MRKFWEEDKLQNIIISQFLKRGGEILGENSGAILVKDKFSGVICISAIDENAGKEILTTCRDYELLLLSQPLMFDYVKQEYSLECDIPCF